ncbi:MAG: hypothetical protein WC785_07415 [Tatlockia sp.]
MKETKNFHDKFKKEVMDELDYLINLSDAALRNAKAEIPVNRIAIDSAQNKFNRLNQLFSMAQEINAMMGKADADKSLSQTDKDNLNKIREHVASAVLAISADDKENLKVSASNLADLSNTLSAKESPVLKALSVSLITFAALALITAGILVAAIAAIPTFGASLAVAAGVVAGATMAATASAVSIAGAGAAIAASQANSPANKVANFKNSLQQIGADEKKNEGNIGGPKKH